MLDAGSGVGTAGLCLAARVTINIVLLERQPDPGPAGPNQYRRQRFFGADGSDLRRSGRPAARDPGDVRRRHDQSPFAAAGSGAAPPIVKAQAHVEDESIWPSWIDLCARRLKTGGWLAVIHRADRIDSLIGALSGRFGATTILPLWPKQGRPAKRIVILARKG